MDCLEGLLGQLREPAATLLALLDQLADRLMGGAQRHAFLDEEFHQRGRIQKAVFEPSGDGVALELCRADQRGGQFEGNRHGVVGVEQRFFVLL